MLRNGTGLADRECGDRVLVHKITPFFKTRDFIPIDAQTDGLIAPVLEAPVRTLLRDQPIEPPLDLGRIHGIVEPEITAALHRQQRKPRLCDRERPPAEVAWSVLFTTRCLASAQALVRPRAVFGLMAGKPIEAVDNRHFGKKLIPLASGRIPSCLPRRDRRKSSRRAA